MMIGNIILKIIQKKKINIVILNLLKFLKFTQSNYKIIKLLNFRLNVTSIKMDLVESFQNMFKNNTLEKHTNILNKLKNLIQE